MSLEKWQCQPTKHDMAVAVRFFGQNGLAWVTHNQ